jgi:hypothetical protein
MGAFPVLMESEPRLLKFCPDAFLHANRNPVRSKTRWPEPEKLQEAVATIESPSATNDTVNPQD